MEKQMANPNNTDYILVPAYGRSYFSTADARKDWEAGKDFRVGRNGPYCSIRDAAKLTEGGRRVFLVNKYFDCIRVC